jgi:hypothetical protein
MVTELRQLNSASDKTGEIVLRGTPEKLIERLVHDDQRFTILDPTYIQDFLLTYRVFIENPKYITSKLQEWFEKLPIHFASTFNSSSSSPSLITSSQSLQTSTNELINLNIKKKIYRIVLEWITNHFNDFETHTELYSFLEKFQDILSNEKMSEQFKVLTIAISTKSKPRTVTLARSKRDEQLNFNVQGGWDKGYGIYVSKVDTDSRAFELGMRRGDQIMDVNGHSFQHITLSNAYDILKSFTHTSITLKYNPISFNEMLIHPDKSPYRNKKNMTTSITSQSGNNNNNSLNLSALSNTSTNNELSHQPNKMRKSMTSSIPPQYPTTQSMSALNNLSTPTKTNTNNNLKVSNNKFQFRLLSNNNNSNNNTSSSNNQFRKILGRFNRKAHSKDLDSHVDINAPSLQSITRSPSPSLFNSFFHSSTNVNTNCPPNSNNTNSFLNVNNQTNSLTRNNSSHNLSTTSSNSSMNLNLHNNSHDSTNNQFLNQMNDIMRLNLQNQEQFLGEHVLKIYKNDQTFKYLVVHKVNFKKLMK